MRERLFDFKILIQACLCTWASLVFPDGNWNKLNLFPLENFYCSRKHYFLVNVYSILHYENWQHLLSPSSWTKKYMAHSCLQTSKLSLYANLSFIRVQCPIYSKGQSKGSHRGRGELYKEEAGLWKDMAKYNLASHLPLWVCHQLYSQRSQLYPSHSQTDSWQSVMFPHFTQRPESLST